MTTLALPRFVADRFNHIDDEQMVGIAPPRIMTPEEAWAGLVTTQSALGAQTRKLLGNGVVRAAFELPWKEQNTHRVAEISIGLSRGWEVVRAAKLILDADEMKRFMQSDSDRTSKRDPYITCALFGLATKARPVAELDAIVAHNRGIPGVKEVTSYERRLECFQGILECINSAP